MENQFYKVVEIKGKGFGCVALRDIEKGTLILEEKPQCVANVGQKCSDGSIPLDLRSVIQSFGRMSKKDQAEYLELSNKYEKIPIPDSVKESYMTLRKEAVMRFVGSPNPNKEFLHEFLHREGLLFPKTLEGLQGFIKVVGIYETNFFGSGLGIKIARFNHSCCPNANPVGNKADGTREVRAVAKIKMNEEICINYGGMQMRNFSNRQKFLSSVYGFKCVCELCEREIMADKMKHFLETNFANDDGSKGDERYGKFEKWQQQAQKLKELSNQPQDVAYPKLMENIKNEILCHKEMYKLVQIRKPSRFITNYGFVINILDDGFRTGVQGYVTAKLHSDSANMEYFKGECQNFSKVGLQLTKVISESDSIFTKDWKERNGNFEQWIMQNDQGFQLGGIKIK